MLEKDLHGHYFRNVQLLTLLETGLVVLPHKDGVLLPSAHKKPIITASVFEKIKKFYCEDDLQGDRRQKLSNLFLIQGLGKNLWDKGQGCVKCGDR